MVRIHNLPLEVHEMNVGTLRIGWIWWPDTKKYDTWIRYENSLNFLRKNISVKICTSIWKSTAQNICPQISQYSQENKNDLARYNNVKRQFWQNMARPNGNICLPSVHM